MDKTTSKPKVKEARSETEGKLSSLGYRKESRGNSFAKGDKKIHVSYSSEFGSTMRIHWKERWRNDYAAIYDYSVVGGPVCVIPMKILFESNFVRHKRAEGYGKSKDQWSQPFPLDHELSKLVLSFKEKWNLL